MTNDSDRCACMFDATQAISLPTVARPPAAGTPA